MSQSFNYRHLYYFWVVAKEGGMARAAERLDMAVQTISAQVRALEQALGVSLLRNEGRNLVLTEAGVAALHEADHIFALGEQLPQRVREAATGTTLRLSLGISDGIAKLAMHRLLQPVLHEPHLRLLCHEGEFQPLLGELVLHKLDAVLADRPAPPNP
ncbi:MAG: LysR family transcriptional regulator, partial [Comamonas sp.]|nr:LysR family transcriptional regulator [Comamonas sp.]